MCLQPFMLVEVEKKACALSDRLFIWGAGLILHVGKTFV